MLHLPDFELGHFDIYHLVMAPDLGLAMAPELGLAMALELGLAMDLPLQKTLGQKT